MLYLRAWTVVCCLLLAKNGAIADSSSVNHRQTQKQNTNDVCKMTEASSRKSLVGIAGYLNDKADTPCLWLLGESSDAKQYVIVEIPKWADDLVGHKISIIGKIRRRSRFGHDVQERIPKDNEVVLTEVALTDGRSPEPKDSSIEDDVFSVPVENTTHEKSDGRTRGGR